MGNAITVVGILVLNTEALRFKSLEKNLLVTDLLAKGFFKGFMGISEGIQILRPTYQDLYLKPHYFIDPVSEREMLQTLSGCQNLEGEELIARAFQIAPRLDFFLSNFVNEILRHEEKFSFTKNTKGGKTTMATVCSSDKGLRILRISHEAGLGWCICDDKIDLPLQWEGTLLFVDPSPRVQK